MCVCVRESKVGIRLFHEKNINRSIGMGEEEEEEERKEEK